MMRITPLLLFVAAAISGCSLSPHAPSGSSTQFAAGYQNLLCKSVAIAEPAVTGNAHSTGWVGSPRSSFTQLFMRLGYKVEAMEPSIFDTESACVVNSTIVGQGANILVTVSIEDPMLDEIIYTANISVRDAWNGVNQDELWSAIENALRPDLAR
jgi:hypothetical protein